MNKKINDHSFDENKNKKARKIKGARSHYNHSL